MRSTFLEYIVLAISFVATGGTWASEWGKRHLSLVIILGLFAFANSAWFVYERWNDLFGTDHKKSEKASTTEPSKPPTNAGTESKTVPPTLPPSYEDMIPLDGILRINVASRREARDRVETAYSVINTGAISTSDIEISVWAATASGLKLLSTRKISYLARNDTITTEHINAPTEFLRVVTCTVFKTRGKTVEKIEYFSNEDQSPQQRLTQVLRHFRDPIVDSGGQRKLCASMPSSAGAITPAPQGSRSTWTPNCLVVNGQRFCE